MDQQKWITDIFNSTSTMQPVLPDAALFGKIQNRIYAQRKFSSAQLLMLAASFLLLLTLNVAIFSSGVARTDNAVNALATSIHQSNQLY